MAVSAPLAGSPVGPATALPPAPKASDIMLSDQAVAKDPGVSSKADLAAYVADRAPAVPVDNVVRKDIVISPPPRRSIRSAAVGPPCRESETAQVLRIRPMQAARRARQR